VSETARILVVDDEIELMKALCDALRSNGYAAEGFTNPVEALNRASTSEFDLLLSDLMMPELDGIVLFKNMLAIDADMVGIIMTGQGTIQTAVEAMKAGVYDYILKPFKIQAIAPILTRAMELRRLRRENVRLRQHVRRIEFESPRYQLIGDG
jgi:DNA-binding NtrC family response regulator